MQLNNVYQVSGTALGTGTQSDLTEAGWLPGCTAHLPEMVALLERQC